MPRGQPDWGAYAPTAIGAGVSDMGELAARLASPVVYDRRGNVIFLEDFEGVIPKFRDASSPACAVRLDSARAMLGSQSCLFATDGTLNRFAFAIFYIAPLVQGRNGVALSANLYEMETNASRFHIALSVQDDLVSPIAEVRLDLVNLTLEYLDEDGNWVIFEDNFQQVTDFPERFHNMKLVVDFDTLHYTRFLFNAESWDMSEYEFEDHGGVGFHYCQAQLTLQDLVGHAFNVHVDNLVYTINEP